MNRADRKQWATARTLADLGELTARWLEGDLASQPGYCGPSDIEDPALVPLLARLNRAGFVTNGSQAGKCGLGHDGSHYEQRAAVEGFASPEMAARLIVAADEGNMTVVAHDPAAIPWRNYRYDRSVTVTRAGGQHRTTFGVQLPRRHIRDRHIGYGGCHKQAVTALCGAWQVTIIDPEWGRPTCLWDALAAVLAVRTS
jgi:hypothetical protein